VVGRAEKLVKNFVILYFFVLFGTALYKFMYGKHEDNINVGTIILTQASKTATCKPTNGPDFCMRDYMLYSI